MLTSGMDPNAPRHAVVCPRCYGKDTFQADMWSGSMRVFVTLNERDFEEMAIKIQAHSLLPRSALCSLAFVPNPFLTAEAHMPEHNDIRKAFADMLLAMDVPTLEVILLTYRLRCMWQEE